MKRRRKIVLKKANALDYPLVIVTLILSLFGIVVAFSASYYYSISNYGSATSMLISNIMWFILGWVALLILSRIDYHWLRHLAGVAIVVGILLLILLLLLRNTSFTKTLNGATRWFKVGSLTFMPSEFVKAAVILFFAAWLSARPTAMKDIRGMLFGIGLLGLIAFLIYKQPNFSTAMIIVAIGFVMMIIAGLPLYTIGIAIILCGILFVYFYFIDTGYMHTRVITALNPWADAAGDGYQVIQSLLALGSGGLKGVGLGKSIQKTLYLPEPQSDFILPIIGEELGLIGIVVLLILYALLIGRIFSIALRAKDNFGCYFAAGTGVMLAIHVILNILVVTATFPPTGVFLPFMSQGGNATLVILALIGVVLNISRQADDVPKEEE